jgi:hypothetical protein
LFLPVLIISIGLLGLSLCGLLLFLSLGKPRQPLEIKASPANSEVDLKKYRPTHHPEIFLDRNLPDHPLKLVKNGIFCGVCLITNSVRFSNTSPLVHTHACTVIRKEWKILICKDAIFSEYFISVGKPHFKKL